MRHVPCIAAQAAAHTTTQHWALSVRTMPGNSSAKVVQSQLSWQAS